MNSYEYQGDDVIVACTVFHFLPWPLATDCPFCGASHRADHSTAAQEDQEQRTELAILNPLRHSPMKMGKTWQKKLLKMAIEIVDLPIENGDSP